jgi:isoquinoline 1-oxidoreductase alpha subunit
LAAFRLTVNGSEVAVEAADDMPLLWVLRDLLGLTGTKYGCGIGVCGSCTVHVGGSAVRSCSVTAGSVAGRDIVTIEGLGDGHPVQEAWLRHRVPQCGYCQPGQIMTAAALLADDPRPSEERVTATMSRVLCRCGTYQRIRRALAELTR